MIVIVKSDSGEIEVRVHHCDTVGYLKQKVAELWQVSEDRIILSDEFGELDDQLTLEDSFIYNRSEVAIAYRSSRIAKPNGGRSQHEFAQIPECLRLAIFEWIVNPNSVIQDAGLRTPCNVYWYVYRMLRCIVYFGRAYSSVEAREYCVRFMREFHELINIRIRIRDSGVERFVIGDSLLTVEIRGNKMIVDGFTVDIPHFDPQPHGIYCEYVMLVHSRDKKLARELKYTSITNSLRNFIRYVISCILNLNFSPIIDCCICRCGELGFHVIIGPESRVRVSWSQLLISEVARLLAKYNYKLITTQIWRDRFESLDYYCGIQKLYDEFHPRSRTKFGILITSEWEPVFRKRFMSKVGDPVDNLISQVSLFAELSRFECYKDWLNRVPYAKVRGRSSKPGSYLGSECSVVTRGECCICLDDIIVDRDSWICCTRCGVEVHKNCYEKLANKSCPICRAE